MNFEGNISLDKRDAKYLCDVMFYKKLMRFFNLQEWEDQNILRLCVYSLILVMFVFNVFIYCYMGEQIIEHVCIKSLFTIRNSIVVRYLGNNGIERLRVIFFIYASQ